MGREYESTREGQYQANDKKLLKLVNSDVYVTVDDILQIACKRKLNCILKDCTHQPEAVDCCMLKQRQAVISIYFKHIL